LQHKVPFGSSEAVFQWLSGFINFERDPSARDYRLDRMQRLAQVAGHPELGLRAVHVAGSKGKGSVTTMVASILTEAGLKTARYLSPHVTEYRERICLNARFFDEGTYAAAGNILRDIVDRYGAEVAKNDEPTFFELLTLFYFLCAQEASCTAGAIETGLGGRLDATNIVTPLVSVITPIEMEHTEYLGNTIAAIAGEKAGIIKASRPVALARQPPEALAVFRAAAERAGSLLLYLPEEAFLTEIHSDTTGTHFYLSFRNSGAFSAPRQVRLAQSGEIQAYNAALAALAVRTAFPEVDEAAIVRGLENTVLPARFERILDRPPFIIDGAHTPESIALTVATFVSLYGDGGLLLFACAADKNAREMARLLVPHFSRVMVTTPGTFKKSDLDGVHQAFRAHLDAGRPELSRFEHTEEAVAAAVEAGGQNGLPILCVGSFYLAAIARQQLYSATENRHASPLSGSRK